MTLDVTKEVTLDSASTIKINQPDATQNAARKGDTADTGDDPAGSHSAGDGTNVIEVLVLELSSLVILVLQMKLLKQNYLK